MRARTNRRVGKRVVMALENCPYPQDVRVRSEALELTAAGFAVTVLAPRAEGQPACETIEGVRVERYRLPLLPGVAGIVLEYAVAWVQLSVRLLAELARGSEIVHLHNPPDLLFPVAYLARAFRRVVIFDHHDLAPELYEQKFGAGWPVRVLLWCERMTMRSADVVLAANESHRRVAIERGGVAPERVVVVRNGPRQATIVSEPRTREHVLRDPRLCFVGMLGSQDGVRLLPEIVARLRARDLSPQLTIVGDGPELPAVKRAASELGVADSVVFTGRVAHEDVPALIAQADVCLDVAPCSPLNHQSTMIKIGEYLAAGRPVVTFPLEETVRTAGECALRPTCGDLDGYCELIVALCNDTSLRATLSRHAVERARALTWEQSAEGLRRAYELATRRLEDAR